MVAAFILLEWLDGVPANVIANVIALLIGVAAAWVWGKFSHRRIWSLHDPSKLVIFVAEDSREYVEKGMTGYVRPSTGIGQVRALAALAPSLRKAYRNVDLGRVILSSQGINRDLLSDLITLGGAKNNLPTREIMNALSARYILPVPSPEEGLTWIAQGEEPKLYEAEGGPDDGDPTRDDRIERDYGVIVKAPNPWNPEATVIVIYGASTHGTAAAASYFVDQVSLVRPKHFTALVQADVKSGYVGEPTLFGLQRLQVRPPDSRAIGPKTEAFQR
jgi:hypothetical protein